MRCPALNELPPPPPGRMGWPWTEESPQHLDTMLDGRTWPLISIVTPSYNQGHFIEGTIRSVLLQGYPNLEYVVIDGGSTDGSVEVIRKYEKWLAYWVSEPDRGQAYAINKGFQKVVGDILAWLNSDDEYCTRALQLVARCFQEKPDTGLLYGDCEVINSKGRIVDRIKGQHAGLAQLLAWDFIPQPSAFFRNQTWEAVGGLNVNLHFILDYELWIRMMLNGIKLQYIPLPLSRFRWHDVSKTRKYMAQFGFEYLAILERLFQNQHDKRFKNIELQAYHHAFNMIVAGYMQATEGVEDRHDELLQALELWDHHLERYQADYVQAPQIWGESLYRIGQGYCLHGRMKHGRRFFSLALQADKRAYKAFLGCVMTFLGVKPYRWYTKGWRALFRSLRRLNQLFSPTG